MTETELKRIEELLSAITPGDWVYDDLYGFFTKPENEMVVGVGHSKGDEAYVDVPSRYDADFIVEALVIVRALIDEVRRLRSEWRKAGVDV